MSGHEMIRDVRNSRLFLIACTALIAACATVTPNLPAITDEPGGERIAGKIVWRDLITHTPEESRRFYGELFGWEFEELGLDFGLGRTMNYTLIRHRGHLIGGMIDANRLDRPNPEELSQWVAFMSVSDLDAAVAAARTGGGKVLTPPTDLADRGRVAIIEDPQGAPLALLSARGGDPADRIPGMGDFLWEEVWTSDLPAALDFYSGLADFTRGSRTLAGGRVYDYLQSADLPRFGILANPAEGLDPTWVSYVRVENPAAITARVEELGGRVLAEPRARDLGGQVALIADPSGAGLAIQTWSPEAGAASRQ